MRLSANTRHMGSNPIVSAELNMVQYSVKRVRKRVVLRAFLFCVELFWDLLLAILFALPRWLVELFMYLDSFKTLLSDRRQAHDQNNHPPAPAPAPMSGWKAAGRSASAGNTMGRASSEPPQA